MTKAVKFQYQCDSCDRVLANSASYSRHRKTLHPDAPKLARGTVPDIKKLELVVKTKPIGKAKSLTRKFALFGLKHVGAKKLNASLKRQ